MTSDKKKNYRAKYLALASATALASVSSAMAQTLGAGQISISTAGSTALKNWFVAASGKSTFTDITPYTASAPGSGSLTVDGVTYPPVSDGGLNYWAGNGGSGTSYQLAPSTNATVQGTSTDSSAAVQFTYHESGSAEGILELANDQIAPVSYVTANIDRNPEGGNAVWLNYNQIGASGTTAGAAFNATTGTTIGSTGLTLGNFYATGVGQTGTPGVTTTWTPGSASNPTPTFTNNAQGVGVNSSGGQNAVQLALSDAYPQQVFMNNYGNTSNTYTPAGGGGAVTQTGSNNTSFNANPLDQGYGQGNPNLVAGSLGTPGFRASYQSPGALNMPATAINPRTGAAFGVGAWNNATNGGLGNLNAQLTAVTATAFVANPGTGLTQVDRTDADWLETTSRLKNGASFNMTTRDVNSGTRDVSSLDTGVDPSYSTGKNDDGNGILPNAVSNAIFDQESIGPAQRFSNKTAGGAQLRPTVQNNRMAVGTLSINDAHSNDLNSAANPLRVLSYSDSVNGTSPYVSPNYATISNGTYVIYQNEVAVTVRAPNANYATNTVTTAANGAQLIQGQIQGDDTSGDVVTVLNQAENSVAFNNAITPADAADGLLDNGYMLPQLMQVTKNLNGEGLNNSVAGQIATGSITSQANPNYDAGQFSDYVASGVAASQLPDLTTLAAVTTGTGSTYGGKGGTFARSFFNGGAINITNNNFLFGNFNQTGTRDFNSAVKSALSADRALITADQAVGASVAGSEFTSQGDNNGVAGGTNGILNTATVSYTDALGVAHTTLTKGDLIVMGDFNGDGHFDGADLVEMAEGASLSDNTGTDRLSVDNYQTGVLNKNAAMDYLNTNVGTTGADLYIRQSGRQILEGTSIPAGATAVLSPITAAQVIDPVSGLKEFSYDPNGTNTFNKSDVNQDGVVDMNDAVVVDNNNGQDFSNLGDQISATEPAPITGAPEPLNLVMAKQSDGATVIDASDVAVVNTQLTGTGTTNWYGYNLQKTGPSTITFARTGGAVNVSAGASFEVSNGTVQIGGTVDPFSGTGATAGHHVALAVDHGATVQFLNSSNAAGSEVAGLSIDGTSVLDLTNNILKVDYAAGTQATADATIRNYLINGRNGGAWNGVGGISSSTAALPANSHYALGYADGADNIVAGLSSGQIEVRYTLLGDADLDGAVTGSDFTILASNLGKGVSRWDQGDFDYDGSVTGSDFTDLVGNLGKSASGAAVQLPASDYVAIDAFAAANGLMSDVPEPGSASLLVIAGMGVLSRRRRSV
jgi:hypothetical protein